MSRKAIPKCSVKSWRHWRNASRSEYPATVRNGNPSSGCSPQICEVFSLKAGPRWLVGLAMFSRKGSRATTPNSSGRAGQRATKRRA